MKFYLSIFMAVCSIGVAVHATSAAWTAPSGAPSSGTNTEGPLDESATDQLKTGGLSVDTLSVVNTMYIHGDSGTGSANNATTLEVEDAIGGGQYCNQDGSVCFTAAEMSSLISSI